MIRLHGFDLLLDLWSKIRPKSADFLTVRWSNPDYPRSATDLLTSWGSGPDCMMIQNPRQICSLFCDQDLIQTAKCDNIRLQNEYQNLITIPDMEINRSCLMPMTSTHCNIVWTSREFQYSLAELDSHDRNGFKFTQIFVAYEMNYRLDSKISTFEAPFFNAFCRKKVSRFEHKNGPKRAFFRPTSNSILSMKDSR